MTLSKLVAINAAKIHQIIPRGLIKFTPQPTRAIAIDANIPATVPSKLTAPSVPLGTGCSVVIKKVLLP